MAGPRVQAVDAFAQLLEEMLQTAEGAKNKNRIEAPLNKSDLGEPYERVDSIFGLDAKPDLKKRSQWAVIETATRDAFNGLLASTTIDSPSFVKLWNLLDTISILSDDEQCDPALLFWLVEELLDSQTISGCRKIFDYLESRRERITAKHFGQKNLVILRSCNELLRRLSRAEDTAFCGRVFMFMFQSFPLGERSTVNLRGEYHTENVTTFDSLPPKESPTESDPEKMDVDVEGTAKITPATKSTSSAQDQVSSTKGVTFSKTESPMSPDELYPIFWSLQQYLNQPKKLFDQSNFTEFKSGLEATMVMFKSVQSDNSGRSDESKRGIKRKRGQGDDDLANAFNPKYLTSRDLFELEISDLSFRRNILVQVLIVVDFLLSMSAKAKEKLAKASLPAQPNKSVMYADQLLSEEDTKWASEMKRSIADYLKQGLEGPFFYRMVETVLSRDKNWVRWKIENCPSITKPAVTPEDYLAAKAAAKKATTNKRLRPNPLGSLDLKFLSESQNRNGLERLKDPSRYRIPSVKSFQSKIELDDMDIEMARDEDAKNTAIESKASKSWRALRIASGSKLVAFDKIERSDKIDVIFQDNVKVDDPIINGDDEAMDSAEVVVPTDRRPIAITGTGKGALIEKLLEKHPKVFSKNISHTTRSPRKGEVHGQHYYFVAKDEFNMLRDGDEFLEYECVDDDNYGTSRKVVEGIIASGKLPIMNISIEGVQQIKENGYPARYIFISSADASSVENSRAEELYDKVIINNDLEATYTKLERYIFVGEIADDARIAQMDGAAEESQSKIEATLEKATAIESTMEVDDMVEAGTPAMANDDTATATK